MGGLKRELVDTIKLQPYWTFNYVIKLSMTIEKQCGKCSSKLTPNDNLPKGVGKVANFPNGVSWFQNYQKAH